METPWWDIVSSGANVLMAGAAIYALVSWRRQMHGAAGYTLATKLLGTIEQVRRSIAAVRNPWIAPEESPPGYSLGPSSSEQKAEATIYVYNNRLAPLRLAIDALDGMEVEARALWGEEVDIPRTELNRCIRLLHWSIKDRVARDREGDGAFLLTGPDFQSILYAGLGEEDAYLNELNSVLDRYAAIARRYLPKSRWKALVKKLSVRRRLG